MMLNDRIPLQIGGFHDHWLRNGTDNATLLAAAAQYYHYDFICLMDGFRREVEQFRQTVESWLPGFRVFLGEERFYGWGHLVTVQNHFSGQDPKNPDIPGEIAQAGKRLPLIGGWDSHLALCPVHRQEHDEI